MTFSFAWHHSQAGLPRQESKPFPSQSLVCTSLWGHCMASCSSWACCNDTPWGTGYISLRKVQGRCFLLYCYYCPLRKAEGLPKLRVGNSCPRSAMTVTLSVREARQTNPFQELGYAWSSHAGSDRSTEELAMCPRARSGPRGKKVCTYHKKNSKENTDVILAQFSSKRRTATFGRWDPGAKIWKWSRKHLI